LPGPGPAFDALRRAAGKPVPRRRLAVDLDRLPMPTEPRTRIGLPKATDPAGKSRAPPNRRRPAAFVIALGTPVARTPLTQRGQRKPTPPLTH
jgi:hypothetical protein